MSSARMPNERNFLDKPTAQSFFPKDQLPHNLSEYIQQLKYVLVGMNPGNAIAEHPQEPFLNFHGSKNSADYRLAAAVYGTKLWGSLMTDLSQQIQSDSTKVRIDANDVQALEHHLDALGVAQDAVLVALGQTTFNNLNKFAQRKVLYIPHYSNSNNGSGDNRWDAKRVHSRILTMTK